jgi:hypothetical protein
LFQPDRFDAQKEIAQRFPGRIGRIDNGNPLHVLHVYHRFQQQNRDTAACIKGGRT